MDAGVDAEADGDAECGKEQVRSLTTQLLQDGRASSHLMWRRLHSQQPLRDLRCARRNFAVFVALEPGREPAPDTEPSGPEGRGDMAGAVFLRGVTLATLARRQERSRSAREGIKAIDHGPVLEASEASGAVPGCPGQVGGVLAMVCLVCTSERVCRAGAEWRPPA